MAERKIQTKRLLRDENTESYLVPNIIDVEYSDMDELWLDNPQHGIRIVADHPAIAATREYRLIYSATTPANAVAITGHTGWFWQPTQGSGVVNTIAVTSAAARTLTAGESGSTIHTTGNAGTAVVNLPPATPGLQFEFVVMTAFALQIEPATGETIGLPSTGVQESANDYITADAVNEYVILKCFTAGAWVPTNYLGTWTGQ